MITGSTPSQRAATRRSTAPAVPDCNLGNVAIVLYGAAGYIQYLTIVWYRLHLLPGTVIEPVRRLINHPGIASQDQRRRTLNISIRFRMCKMSGATSLEKYAAGFI